MRPFTARSIAALATTAALTPALVVGLASPAGALTSVSTSGTTITVTVSGSDVVNVFCVGGTVQVNGSTGSPAVPCATFSKLTVNGDSGQQTIDGTRLESAAFAAKPYLVAALGAGNDTVTPTSRADSIDLGPGDDNLYTVRSVTDTLLEGGADKDYIRLQGTDAADDQFVATSTNATLTVLHRVNGVDRTSTAKDFEQIQAATFAGDDVVDMSGITMSSTLVSSGIFSGAGDDEVRGPQRGSNLDAGTGTNTIFGGLGNDVISSSGNKDTIDGVGGSDYIYDRVSGRSGRTIANHGTDSWYYVEAGQGDMVSRIRPVTANDTRVTNSLARPGQQELSNAFDNFSVSNGVNASAYGRGLFDVVALNGDREVYVRGDQNDNDILDVTIPTGSWTVGISGGDGWITPAAAGYKPIRVENMGPVKVHTPWVNKDVGFAHRVMRDLLMRFPTDQERDSRAGALGTASTTRAAIVADLMDTDEYRGLDVDRVFVRYLRRQSDPSGRTYWINSLKSGKALWRFRAQLFGSNEYFTKAGGTNAGYIDKVYFDVLGRLPDPSGRTYWTNKLDGGAERGSVALQFIKSAEFQRFVVDDEFLRFLDRKPSGIEQSTWAPQITGSATGEQDLIAMLAASTEYYNRS